MKYNKPTLKKYGHLKNITFSRDSDTWEHNTPTKPGHITDVGTGESRKLTEKEKNLYRNRK